MRLAVVLPGLDPSIGGGFTFVEEVARALECAERPEGLEIVIIGGSVAATAARIPQVPLPRERAGARTRRRIGRLSQRLARALGGDSAVERAAREAGASVVWFPTGGSEPIDLPFVATVWDIQHRTHPWFPEVSTHGLWWAREEGSRELLGRAALVVCGTVAGAKELEFYYQVPRDRVVIAPHPTPGWALRDGAEDPGVLPDGPFFLYPAQFWPHKNHAMLLRALAERHRAGSRASLVLPGGDLGAQARVRELATELGLGGFVRFPGFVSRAALRALYGRALGLVYAAFSGPENLPPLEACALGCPVVNADFPGAREQLGDAALYFDPLSARSIAAAMERLETDSALRQRLVTAGRVVAGSRRGEAFVERVLRAIDARRAMLDPFAGGR